MAENLARVTSRAFGLGSRNRSGFNAEGAGGGVSFN